MGDDISDVVRRVFEYWKLVHNHPRAQLDPKRQKTLRGVIKTGYTEEDCMLAIEGCADSSFHQGVNDSAKIYDSIGLIFRDADHVDRFIEIGQALRRKVAKQAQVALDKASGSAEKAEPKKPMPDNVRERVRAILASKQDPQK